MSPKKRALLTFFSTDASRWEDIYVNKIEEGVSKFCVFGNFDILLLAFDHSIEDLQGFEEELYPFELSQDYRYHFGTLYHPQDLNVDELSNTFPLLVVSSVKFKKEMWGSLKDDVQIDNVCEWLKAQVEDAIEEIGVESVKFAIVIPYGWEDFILLFFSTSYSMIKRVICKLRTLKFDDDAIKLLLKEGSPEHHRHLIATTCSIPAVKFDYDSEVKGGLSRRRKKAKERLLDRIKKDEDGILGEIRFQVRPGHLDWLRQRLKGVPGTAEIILGRNDLILFPDKRGLFSFFEIFFDHILPLLEDQGSPVASIETSFSFSFDGIQVEEEIDTEWRSYYQEREDQRKKEKKELEKEVDLLQKLPTVFLNVPYHTIKAITNLLHTGYHLKRDYELINDSFISLFNLIDLIRVSLCEIATKERVGKLKEEKDFWHQIADWLKEFDLCFKDRFRGVYPAGETSTMPLITYQGSFCKFLTIVDAIASWVFDKALCRVESMFKGIPLCALSSHIGNPPSPNILSTPILRSGFINLPVDLMFYPERLFYIYHETGHAFFLSIGTYSEIRLERERFFNDILADYFCGVIGFGGEDWEDCKRLFMEYERSISPYKTVLETEARIFLAEAIHQHINGKIDLEDTEVCNRLLKLDSLQRLDAKGRSSFLYVLSQFIEALKRKEFRSLLHSLQDTSISYNDPEKEAIFQDILNFFKQKGISDEDRRQFFYSIWLKIHRKVVKEYFL
jgi:hypothetical protein